jgi:hypothetical protein
VKTIKLVHHLYLRIKIFFRLTGAKQIFATMICGMPIFKKPIYQERTLKALICGARIFRGPTCEVPDFTAANWLGQISHKLI